MRTVIFSLLVLIFCAVGAGYAYVQAHPALRYYGVGDSSTPPFSIQDNWQASWVSAGALKVELLPIDGGKPITITDSTGFSRGISFQEHGGKYRLSIHGSMPWLVTATNLDNPGSEGSSAGSVQEVPVVAPPATPAVSAAPPVTSASNANSQPVPGTAASSNPAPVNSEKAMVLIKGDNAQGTGFLVKMPDGPAVITNIHVMSNNPNVKIITSSGVEIKPLSFKGAVDRDLMEMTIQDANYTYLELSKDVAADTHPTDQVTTPGNSQGGEVMLDTKGRVLGVGPQRVEISNPIYHGNSGGPIVQASSGRVLGVVTEAMKVVHSDELDQASAQSANSAITGEMRYFGLRLDNVPGWETYDWRRFQNETLFLDQFHDQSRRLDTLFNPDARRNAEAKQLYLTDEGIKRAIDNYEKQTDGYDGAQKMDALRQLNFDLLALTDSNMLDISVPANFYSFDRQRAQDEVEYRKALRKQLESLGDEISKMADRVHSND